MGVEQVGYRVSRVLALAAAGVACAGLVGCQSNPDPKPLPSAASITSSPSPRVTKPTMPPEAKGAGPKAAKAFARFYVEAVNHAIRTGELDPLAKLGTPECISCSAISRNVKNVYAQGGHVERGGWRLDNVRVLQATRNKAVVSLAVRLERETVVNRDGTSVTHRGNKQPMTMVLISGGTGYLVSRLDLVS